MRRLQQKNQRFRRFFPSTYGGNVYILANRSDYFVRHLFPWDWSQGVSTSSRASPWRRRCQVGDARSHWSPPSRYGNSRRSGQHVVRTSRYWGLDPNKLLPRSRLGIAFGWSLGRWRWIVIRNPAKNPMESSKSPSWWVGLQNRRLGKMSLNFDNA